MDDQRRHLIFLALSVGTQYEFLAVVTRDVAMGKAKQSLTPRGSLCSGVM